MNLLVCGGAGYIGSHVNQLLNQQGHHTVVFDNLVYGHREAVKWGELIVGDLADQDALEQVFETHQIDAVFHFAAYAYVGESVQQPEKYYENNVVNTLNLLKVMRRHKCKYLVFSSTCATYGEPERVPITEDMPQHPENPYGATKLMVERILKDYHLAYGLNFAVLRYFNAAGADPERRIGESHSPETHLIPLILDAASQKKSNIQVFGTDYDTPDGSCIRDYIHVCDLAQAHLLALNYLVEGGKSDCFNLGNGSGVSVFQVIDAVHRVTGKQIPVVLSKRRPGDPAKLVGSSEKAREILKWQPQYSDIDTIVKHAWQWHENAEY